MPYLLESPPGARTLINGRWRDYFSGTGYLGLQGHPGLLSAASSALARYGLTTATSRGGYGEHPLYASVERAAARFWDVESALYYVSGYLGSAVLLQALDDAYDRIFVDAAAHFSVWNAARAARKPVHAYRHLDAAHLAAVLRRRLRPGERPLLLTDGVFPISGEVAPLPLYEEVLGNYESALVFLDDAHATGVLGAHGRGTLDYWLTGGEIQRPAGSGVAEIAVYSAHTLSKAIGGHGGVIAGDAALSARLHAIPTSVAASPPPLPVAAASAWALDHARAHPELRARLRENVATARRAIRALGWPLEESPVPILCLGARPRVDLARLQEELFARDICVAHVTHYSSTPPGGALRIAIFATHTAGQIARLAGALADLLA